MKNHTKKFNEKVEMDVLSKGIYRATYFNIQEIDIYTDPQHIWVACNHIHVRYDRPFKLITKWNVKGC